MLLQRNAPRLLVKVFQLRLMLDLEIDILRVYQIILKIIKTRYHYFLFVLLVTTIIEVMNLSQILLKIKSEQ